MNQINISGQFLLDDLAKMKEIDAAFKQRNRQIAFNFACYVGGAVAVSYIAFKTFRQQ